VCSSDLPELHERVGIEVARVERTGGDRHAAEATGCR